MKQPKAHASLLRQINPEKTYGSSLTKLCRHFWVIDHKESIIALADAWQALPEVLAVGIVNEEGKALGLVSRDHLFTLLGKPYGRDILKKRPVADICEQAPQFNLHSNIFSIAQDLKADLDLPGLLLYILIDGQSRFQGIFTSHDLLAFLSRITQEDIQLAAGLQERLVNDANQVSQPEWHSRAWARFAKGVGGDFHYSRKISDHRHFMTLCDVSGKGVAASIISSMIWGMLRMFDFRRGLRDLIVELNAAVITGFQLEKYLTGIFMVYHENKRRLTIADLGHSHVLIFRRGRAVAIKSPSTNLPIGIDPGLEPLLFSCNLEPGDRILAFTDGISEQENPQGEEFGDNRIKETVLHCLANNLDISIELPKAVDNFRKGTPQQDDMSFIYLALAPDSPN